MSRTLIAVKGLAKMGFIDTVRYGFEFVSQMVVVYVVFVIVFFGARGLLASGADAEQTLSAIVVGFATWFLAVSAYSRTANDVLMESTAGTLEQLAMSPLGLPRVLLAKLVAGLGLTFGLLALMLVLMMATSGRWLNIDVVSLVPLLLLTLAGVDGVGLMLGGLALVFKRVQASMQIAQFLFVFLVAAPLDRAPWLKVLPLAWGNELIERVMVDGTSIFRIPAGDVIFLAVHGALWLGLGVYVFSRLERVAKDRALLGQY